MTVPDPTGNRGRLYTYSLGFQRQRRIRRMLSLAGWDMRLGWPGKRDTVGVWGQRPVAARGRWVSRRSGARLVTIEDGFLRSLSPGVTGAAPLSLVIDDLGIYYDAARPSRLEVILNEVDLNTQDETRARSVLDRLLTARLSKYTPPVSPRTFGSGHVVVIDQTVGDASIRGAGADETTFQRMLQTARAENPSRAIVVKTHPDVLIGAKRGHLRAADLQGDEQLVAEQVNPWDLINGATAVYTVSSLMGYEAILAGVPVRTFGQAFYAGWGLSEDEVQPDRRGRELTAMELFAGAHLQYPIYYDPWRDRLTDIETVIDALEVQRTAETPASDATGEVFANVRLWKRNAVARFRPNLARRPKFTDGPGTAAEVATAEQRHCWFWASKAPLEARRNLEQAGFVEDGFIRSVGLGAELHEPASLVFDSQGIYFDPNAPSDLEALIAAATNGQADTDRAALLRQQIVSAGITKYNVGSDYSPDRPAGRQVVLVPGQVEDDASVLRGCGPVRTNLALLQAARAANPDAWLIWKPHPDVESGLREGAVPRKAALDLADEVAEQASVDDLLHAADSVWTLTSLMGFEALMRGKAVTCLGTPFYAGWGLTEDLGPSVARRTARPTLDQLVWAALIAYPRYRDPVSGLPCRPELVVERFANGQTTRQATVLSKLQGAFAGVSWLWR